MNQSNPLPYLAAAAIGALALLAATLVDAGDGNPHLVERHGDPAACLVCHNDDPSASPNLPENGPLFSRNLALDAAAFRQDGVAMCTTCHNPNVGHKVGLNIDFPVPADLPLNADNDITCLTCHYTHGRLDSDRPQASFSFMDRMLNAERLHKSFLLRRNNSDGELCLTCHNVNQGP